jgi:transcriptional regulator with XRE-family HTH domain
MAGIPLPRLDLDRALRVRSAQEVRPVEERKGGPKGSGLTPQVIEEEKARGLNQNQIAAKYGVTRQTVSGMKRLRGRFSMTPRERVLAQFPWKIPARFNDAEINRNMRNHAEYVATGGKGMSDRKLKRLASFYRRLERDNLVVEFDPDIEPNEFSQLGGFRLVPREDSDGDLMIRVNDCTVLTDEGRRFLWRIPQRRPEV